MGSLPQPLLGANCLTRKSLGDAQLQRSQKLGTSRRQSLGISLSPGLRASAEFVRSRGVLRDDSSNVVTYPKSDPLYSEACRRAQRREYKESRLVFEELLSRQPDLCQAWVSYAQMEKKASREDNDTTFTKARAILQRAMSINPHSGCLAQAWGLLELQRGNAKGATNLLERCVHLNPKLSPVLRWKNVRQAKLHAQCQGKSNFRVQKTSFCGSPPTKI